MSEELIQAADEDEKAKAKRAKKMERKLVRAEERLVDYERLVDRTQHLLNTRIEEVEAARAALAARTEELEESEQRFRQLADAAFEAIIIHAGEQVLDCNEAAIKLYHVSKPQLLQTPFLNYIHPTSLKEGERWLHHATQEPVELAHQSSDGEMIPVEIRSRSILHKGQPALITAIRDISTHKAMQAKLNQIANSDPLTGVGNRRFFMEMGHKEYFRAVRYTLPLSLVMLDVDHFKRINDTYGHDIGDVALKALTKVCVNTLRDCDVLARIGGEEFAIILPGSDLSGGTALAERLRKNVEDNQIETEKGTIAFTVSMGITALHAGDDGIETLLNRADTGLYRAKEGGRNQVDSE
ncbi:MAG: sensor domain-containing diguanylate cyclase [Halopseudomonas sp.]